METLSKNAPVNAPIRVTLQNQHEIGSSAREKTIRDRTYPTTDLLADLRSERKWAERETRTKVMGSARSNNFYLSTLPKIPGYDITDADAPSGLDKVKFRLELEASGNQGIGSKVVDLSGNVEHPEAKAKIYDQDDEPVTEEHEQVA